MLEYFCMFLKKTCFRLKKFLITIIIVIFLFGIYGFFKPLPKNVDFIGSKFLISEEDVHFLSDKTFLDFGGNRKMEQQIFSEVFKMIDNAHSYILIDMFLFNDMLGVATSSYRNLSGELVQKLIEKKEQNEVVVIQFITDPINEIYGGISSYQMESLRRSGINVITTNLKVLRDSNPLYSGFWRAIFSWFGNSKDEGFLPNPFEENGQKLGIRTYLSLFNFKANHRKVVLADKFENGVQKFSVLITSANPHDGSSAHSNTAVLVDEGLWKDVLKTEREVVWFSGFKFIEPNLAGYKESFDGEMSVQLLTEKSIKRKILEELDSLQSGDFFDMAMFYVSDRDIVKAIKKADRRGVKIRLLFDPNKDAFGRKKDGVPNRQVASEILKNANNTEIKWCLTHGEQCHFKLTLFRKNNSFSLIQGSANLTRRNLENFNLETDVFVSGRKEAKIFKDAGNFFDEIWNNENGRIYSTDYEDYKDERFAKRIQYLLMEYSGLSSF